MSKSARLKDEQVGLFNKQFRKEKPFEKLKPVLDAHLDWNSDLKARRDPSARLGTQWDDCQKWDTQKRLDFLGKQSEQSEQQDYPERTGISMRSERYCAGFVSALGAPGSRPAGL
jgi:hypothetical protein